MVALKGFKVATVSRPAAASGSPEDRVRQNLKKACAQQLALAEQARDGKAATRAEGKRGPSKWFFENHGTYFVSVRYANTNISPGGDQSYEAGTDIKDVISLLEKLEERIDAGDLDADAMKVARERGERLTDRKGARDGETDGHPAPKTRPRAAAKR